MNETPDLPLATTIRLLLDYLFFIIDYFRNYSQFCKYDIFPIITPHRCLHNGQGTALFMHIGFELKNCDIFLDELRALFFPVSY